MKKRIILIVLIIVTFFASSFLNADDREIFSGTTLPYIMFILDNSGSMGTRDFIVAYNEPDKKANFESYTTSTGKTYTFSTTLSYDGRDYATRIEVLKRVTIELVDVFRDTVKMGFSHFLYEGSGSSRSHGGLIFADIGDYSTGDIARDLIFDSITDYIYDHVNADEYTPLAESLDTAYGYFAGMISGSDGNMWENMYRVTRIPLNSVTPPQYTCQNTFLILITDGEPTADDFSKYWYSDSGFEYRYTGETSYLLDVTAKWIFEHPIFPASSGIVTYTVGMKMSSTGEELLQRTADMEHGRGKYFPGNDFSGLKDSLLYALQDILQRNFAFSAYTSPKRLTTASDQKNVSFSGYFLNQPEGIPIYEGHLECLEIVEDGDTYKFVKKWDAAEEMPTAITRELWTAITDTDSHNLTRVVNFTSSQSSLLQTPLNGSDSSETQQIIDYIRGEAADRPLDGDGELFLLADVFHSEIGYLGKPLGWKKFFNPDICDENDPENDQNCYQRFSIDNENRKSIIFAGTNDGIFHCFDGSFDGAEKGKELWGFIPDEVMPALKSIAVDKIYNYGVDGFLTVDDIYTGVTDYWKTIVVFGLREGGKAYYCLNVTDPDPLTGYPDLKWKFPAYKASGKFKEFATSGTQMIITDRSLPAQIGQYIVNEQRDAMARITNVEDGGEKITVTDLEGAFTGESSAGAGDGDKVLMLPPYYKYIGESWGKPIITRIKYKKGSAGSTIEEWVVILTGGFSNDNSNEEGKAIFILNAWTGEPIWMFVYDDGLSGYDSNDNIVTNDYVITKHENHNYSIPQALTAVDLDSNYYIDTIFFGNTGGSLFKLDMKNPLTTTWVPETILRYNNVKQPIFQRPSVSYDSCYNLWVHFGTGNRDRPQGEPGSQAGRFFGIKVTNSIPSMGYLLSDLYDISSYWDALDDSARELGIGGDKDVPVDLSVNQKGWYFNFPVQDEILFEPAPLILPYNSTPHLYFNTYQPTSDVIGGDPCGMGGNMRLYTINLHTCGTEISGEREESRIQGGGMLGGTDYLLYIGDPATGSLQQKEFKKISLPYPGGVLFWKEKRR